MLPWQLTETTLVFFLSIIYILVDLFQLRKTCFRFELNPAET